MSGRALVRLVHVPIGDAPNGRQQLVLDAAGPVLPDNACLLILDWHGGPGTTRPTTADADLHRASNPTGSSFPGTTIAFEAQ